jgi:hypothetical protein
MLRTQQVSHKDSAFENFSQNATGQLAHKSQAGKMATTHVVQIKLLEMPGLEK